MQAKVDADIKTWVKIATDRLKQPRKQAVFHAVGPGLQEAMIAQEVMDILIAQAEPERISIERFERLYDHLRRALMPEMWEDVEN